MEVVCVKLWYYKSVKLLQIVEGTSEVQRMLIARILAGSSHR